MIRLSIAAASLVAGAALLAPLPARAETVSTVAGSGAAGAVDGTGRSARFSNPTAIAADREGNLYVADQTSNRIRKIGPGGTVTTLAGSGQAGAVDGPGAAASFSSPSGLAVDGAGNVYVADYGNNLIRKVSPSGLVSTLAGSRLPGKADGKGKEASFNSPLGLAVDGAGNVYVADSGNNLIRLVAPGGAVSTIAGSAEFSFKDGPANAASFGYPVGLAVDGAGNLYVADQRNNRIRLVTRDGLVKTLAGTGEAGRADGDARSATFSLPTGLTLDAAGDLLVADQANNRIRRISHPR